MRRNVFIILKINATPFITQYKGFNFIDRNRNTYLLVLHTLQNMLVIDFESHLLCASYN